MLELLGQKKDGDSRLSHVSELNAKTQLNTSSAGKEILKRELEALKSDWDSTTTHAEEALGTLQIALEKWKEFDETHTVLNNWLRSMEQQLKDFELRSTLEEKQEQVERFKSMRSDIQAHQTEVDKFTDMAQALMESSSDVKLNTHVNQATSRYQALQASIKVCTVDDF